MVYEPHSHCHKCGSTYRRETADMEWPKRCTNDDCRNLQFVNPIPISVMLQTVTDGSRIGILTPIRGHAPMIGRPAGTGGFVEITDQSAEHGGAREKHEEVGESLGLPMDDEDGLEPLCSRATGPFIPTRRQLLMFSVNPEPQHVSLYDGFTPDAETTAIEFSWAPRSLAFPSHTYALARYFLKYQGVKAPEAYTRQARTGDPIEVDSRTMPIFNIPYVQDRLDDGVWNVEIADDGVAIPAVRRGSVWVAQ